MKPYYQSGDVTLYHGDCLAVLPALAAGSIDAVITDPPAGISFMGKTWDKPRGYGFTDGASRVGEMPGTLGASRNPVCRKCRKHQRGQTEPHCVCEAPDFDTHDGRLGERAAFVSFLSAALAGCLRLTAPGGRLLCWAIPRTSHWAGTAVEDAGWIIEDRIAHLFGQGFPKGQSKLKPACEDWWLARKSGRNVLPLNIDECRVPGPVDSYRTPGNGKVGSGGVYASGHRGGFVNGNPHPDSLRHNASGRWPANVCHDGSEEVLEAFAGFGEKGGGFGVRVRHDHGNVFGNGSGLDRATIGQTAGHGGTGTAARFFYCAKASKKDRGEGNDHPTVKNTALMEWLARLITPPDGLTLDPFFGSGTTAVACLRTGRKFVGVELSEAYCEIAARRLEAEARKAPLFGAEPAAQGAARTPA